MAIDKEMQAAVDQLAKLLCEDIQRKNGWTPTLPVEVGEMLDVYEIDLEIYESMLRYFGINNED